ncbi:hypothetical protein FRB94_008797 [Tulasnella sp. JGI-2019a]|nr:hypothetical protein FRB93_012939 [Tulasnella sp. JGI-2019a]KAG9011198.1 hypothetical protein FRB94_008797 [Tulasnella sp. JGI-2019a]KAG9035358.1 hypothetical protein FRB95_011509 [Tulasnella sp. JGI-2019a]
MRFHSIILVTVHLYATALASPMLSSTTEPGPASPDGLSLWSRVTSYLAGVYDTTKHSNQELSTISPSPLQTVVNPQHSHDKLPGSPRALEAMYMTARKTSEGLVQLTALLRSQMLEDELSRLVIQYYERRFLGESYKVGAELPVPVEMKEEITKWLFSQTHGLRERVLLEALMYTPRQLSAHFYRHRTFWSALSTRPPWQIAQAESRPEIKDAIIRSVLHMALDSNMFDHVVIQAAVNRISEVRPERRSSLHEGMGHRILAVLTHNDQGHRLQEADMWDAADKYFIMLIIPSIKFTDDQIAALNRAIAIADVE